MTEDRATTPADTGGAAGRRAGNEPGDEAAARATLRLAVGLARTGDGRRARDLCAAVVFHAQPLIAAREELRRLTLHALLVARGFRLLSRLVRAIGGSDVEIVLLPHHGAGTAPVCRAGPRGRTTYFVHPGWLARLSPDDAFVRSWSEALAWGDCRHPDASVAQRPEGLLQPA